MKKSLVILSICSGLSCFGQITLLDENFDAPEIPNTWTIIDNDGFQVDSAVIEYDNAWIIKTDPTDSTNKTVSSTSYFSPVNRADRWLITPQITLEEAGNFVSWAGMSHDASFPDSYKVMVSTNSNAIEDFTDTLAVISNEMPIWTSHLHSLKKYDNEKIYLAFVNTTYDGFKLYLDSIYVRGLDPLSVSEQKEINVEIFPNPTADFLFLDGKDVQIQDVVVYNSFGQKVSVKYFNENPFKVKIDLSNLKSGFYYLSVETAKGILQQKIIKN